MSLSSLVLASCLGVARLLAGHGDAKPFLGVDEVVVVVVAKIDLYPGDPAGELTGRWGVVGGDGGSGLVTDVGGLIRGEDHRLGDLYAAGGDVVAVVVQSDVASLGQSPAVVRELHPHLVGAFGDRRLGLRGELVDAKD